MNRYRPWPQLGSDDAFDPAAAGDPSMLPVLVSQLVVVLKDTAIGYQITFLEMVRQGTVIGSTYGNYLPALIVIAVLMISVNFALSAAATRLERRLRRSKRTPEQLPEAAVPRAIGCRQYAAGTRD